MRLYAGPLRTLAWDLGEARGGGEGGVSGGRVSAIFGGCVGLSWRGMLSGDGVL